MNKAGNNNKKTKLFRTQRIKAKNAKIKNIYNKITTFKKFIIWVRLVYINTKNHYRKKVILYFRNFYGNF